MPTGYPPSPALSTCSEDLDAILNAAGPMSRLPTPPLPKKSDRRQIYLDGIPRKPTDDYRQPAQLLAQKASLETSATQQHINNIHNILIRAHLPRELIVIAYNILGSLNLDRDDYSPFFQPQQLLQPDQLTATALALAESYTCDHARGWRTWAQDICGGAWTAKQLDRTAQRVLTALGYRLREHASPDAVERAMRELFDSRIGVESHLAIPAPATIGMGSGFECRGRKGKDHDIAAPVPVLWPNGVVTPEASPPWVVANSPEDSCY